MDERLEELELEIIALEKKIAPLYEEKELIFKKKQEAVHRKIELCLKGEYAFSKEELRFARKAVCSCGSKLAYPVGIGMYGSWYCSDVLMDRNADQEHVEPIPFLDSDID